MNTLDSRLLSIARQSLAVCRSVSEALTEVCKENGARGGVTLSLQSRYGVLIRIGETTPTLDLCSHPLLNTLYSSESEERIALLLGDRDWNMVSCFSLSGIAFYPVITIPSPPNELRWVRYELLAALDCFSLNCKQALEGFITGASTRLAAPPLAVLHRGSFEKALLENLLGYSDKVDCAALLDNDGFVLIAAGPTDRAEAIASNLALFNRQAVTGLNHLGNVAVRSLSIGDSTSALLIGRTPGRNVSLALSVRGEGAGVIARFLFDAGVAIVGSIAGTQETLGDYGEEMDKMALRRRDSWLSAPRLVPQGAYAAVDGEKTFHDPGCSIPAKGDDVEIQWFDTRAEAIKAGFAPCKECNP
jgi:hypothetical protein